MCSQWQANSVASRRVFASRNIRRVCATSTSGSCSRPSAASFAQFVIRLRRPEEVTQPARQFPIGNGPLPGARQPASRSGTKTPAPTSTRASVNRNASSCGIPSLRRLSYKRAQTRALLRRSAAADRPAPRNRSATSTCFGSQSTKQLPKRRRPIVDRLPQRLEHFRVGVLRCEFQQLRKRIDRRQRIAADEMQLVPQPIELLPLRRRPASAARGDRPRDRTTSPR